MGRTFALSDVHGCYIPFKKAMDFLQPDDKLYFIGDCCDRGDDGVKIFKELTSDPRITYIRGNHEEMMMDSIPYCVRDINEYGFCYTQQGYDLWTMNGGRHTYKDFEFMAVNEIYDIREKIKKMHSQAIYISPAGHKVILEHAGYSPFVTPHRTHDPLWDRKHFYDDWSDGHWEKEDCDPEKTYLVHGHTPVQYLEYQYGYKGQPQATKESIELKHQWKESCYFDTPWNIKPTIIRYCNGHKFDIDMGTVFTKRVALLDLDTFEETYFDEEKN